MLQATKCFSCFVLLFFALAFALGLVLELFLVTLQGRMPKGVGCVCYEG
jgi:hypothetical protein